MKIYVFGNKDFDFDNSGINISKELSNHFKEIEFIYIDNIDSFTPTETIPVIIDTASNISKVIVIDNPDKLQTNNNTSNHDFDLAMTLKLLKKLRKIDGFIVICIPKVIKESDTEDCKKIISQLLSSKN